MYESTHEEILEQHGFSEEEFQDMKQALEKQGFEVKEVKGENGEPNLYYASLDGKQSHMDFLTSTDAWMFVDENMRSGIFD